MYISQMFRAEKKSELISMDVEIIYFSFKIVQFSLQIKPYH